MTGFIILISIIAIAFILIVSYEAIVSYRKNIRVYTLADSLVNVYCGIMERAFDLFYAVLFLMASQYIYENIAPFKIPSNLFTWIIGLLVFDLFAYWFHRLSHEINFFWAAHIVHHQSEELNFTTVFRVSFFAVIFRSLFFIWMPLFGFDPFTIFTLGVFLAGYQFLTHSRVIGRLGILEEFMTTPSHHRVHHGRNPKYMDHNYGHIFIIWDRLFGTFVREDEEPEYGITSGFESNSALRAQFSYWQDLFTRAGRAKNIKDKVKIFLKGPAWTPEDVGFLPYEFKTNEKGERLRRDVRISKEMSAYILIATAFTVGCFVRLIWLTNQLETPSLATLIQNAEIVGLAIFTLISVFAHGRVLENSRIAFPAEMLRLVSLAFVATHFFGQLALSTWLMPIVLGYSALAALWMVRLTFFSGQQIRLVAES